MEYFELIFDVECKKMSLIFFSDLYVQLVTQLAILNRWHLENSSNSRWKLQDKKLTQIFSLKF